MCSAGLLKSLASLLQTLIEKENIVYTLPSTVKKGMYKQQYGVVFNWIYIVKDKKMWMYMFVEMLSLRYMWPGCNDRGDWG